MCSRLFQPVKSFLRQNALTKTQQRFAGAHHDGGEPGENLPFNLPPNKIKFTLYCLIFFGSGLMAPNCIVTYQMLKRDL